MIIHIEGFDQDNEYFIKTINPFNKKISDLRDFFCYDWYDNGIQLDKDFNEWIDGHSYYVIFNVDFINFFIKYNNIIIATPLINSKLTVQKVKYILSIKDNIYFKNIRLKENKTLEYYNIKNNDILFCSNNYAVAGTAVSDC